MTNHVRRPSYGPNSPVVGERGARTRQAVAEAAVRLFGTQGLDATSVDDIAEAAGVSRATLYQYFASKEDLFLELIRDAAADLLRVIRRLGALGPTAEGYDNLHWWLGEWAWVQDKYRELVLQWPVIDAPETSLRPVIAQHIVAYVQELAPRLARVTDDELDVDAVATVLLALLFRLNDYRQRGIRRGLDDDQILDAVATFVQLALFPLTPAGVCETHTTGPRGEVAFAAARAPDPARVSGREATTRGGDAANELLGLRQQATRRRILDAGASAFALRGYQRTSVQDVLQTAGVGRGTFYRYFDDKSDLLTALADYSLVQLEDLALRFRTAVGDGPPALREWLATSIEMHRRYRGVFRALVQEESRDPGLMERRLLSGASVLRAFDDGLAMVERAHPFEIRVGSLILLALLERGPDYAYGTKYDLSDDRIVEVLAVLVERGLLDGTSLHGRHSRE